MRAGPAALLVLRALTAEIADPSVEVRWEAPAECGGRDELITRIETLLGRPLGEPGDPDLDVVARVQSEGDEMILVLEFRQPVARVRQLRGHTCTELREAAAVVLAVTIDPLVPLDEDEPPKSEPPKIEPPKIEPPKIEPPEVEAAPEPEIEAAPEPEVEAPSSSTPQLGLRLRVGGGVHYGALPGVAGGPSLAIGLRWRALRAELVGTWWLSKAARFDAVPEVGATLSLGWVAPRVCGVPSTPRVAFPLCAGVELGGMRAASFGVPSPRPRTLPWVAAELGAAVSVGLGGPLALWIGLDGIIPLTRPGFTIGGLGELHRAPPFAFQTLLGLEIRLATARATDPGVVGQGSGT